MKKTQVIIVSVFGLLVLLVIWTISAMKGKEENQNTVRLSTDNKDVTITAGKELKGADTFPVYVAKYQRV